MRRIKMKSGGFLLIGLPEEIPENEIGMSEAEFAWMQRLTNSVHDPEEKAALWAGVIEKKRSDKGYLVFDSFPVEEAGTDSQSIAMRYSSEIIDRLKGKVSS